ncbi:helix-turn-helix domain-containing protein [Streptomyces mobaraensis]|uniref:helix-turn-helix domain-containing protein n=1 Tax=Streptomyces mobaraensis TaxID=35621 RepID=UPI0033E7A702
MAGAGPLDPYQARVLELGKVIREHRMAKGWRQVDLGNAVALSNTAISHFEKGTHVPRRDVVRRIDTALEARGRIWKLRDELDDNPDAKWVRRAFWYESRAVGLRGTSCVIPALLQNPEYERAIIERGIPFYGGNVADKLKYRARRHQILEGPRGPQLTMVLTEAALHAVVGSGAIMREQLADLIAASREPGFQVRVAPFEGDASVVQSLGEFTIMDLPAGKKVVFVSTGVQGYFVTKPETVAQYVGLYNQLQARVPNSEASRALIRRVLKRAYRVYL